MVYFVNFRMPQKQLHNNTIINIIIIYNTDIIIDFAVPKFSEYTNLF